jgi:hypothetical protein
VIPLDGKHVLLTEQEYRKLLSGEKPAALAALERADSHVQGVISNASGFESMAERVVEACEQYALANAEMPEWVEMCDSHADSVALLTRESRLYREMLAKAEEGGST